MYGKDKGQEFERTISQRLSMWVSKGVRKDVFWRSASSGGRRVDGKPIDTQAGDIVAVDTLGFSLTNTFVIECKYWADLAWEDLVYRRASGLLEFEWKKLTRICASVRKEPFFLVKKNRRHEIVGVTHAGLHILNACSSRTIDVIATFKIPEQLDMVIVPLSDLLVFVDPTRFIDAKASLDS